MKYLNEKGNGLFLTILVVVFVSVIGVGLLTVTANSNKTTVNERFDQSIYYIAEAGLNLEKATLYLAINSAYTKTLEEFRKKSEEELPHFNFTTTFESFLCSTNLAYCNALEKEYSHFQKQYNKQPLAKTRVLKVCASTAEVECTFTIQSDGYFDDQPTKSRQLVQSLTVRLGGYSNNNDGQNGQTPGTNTPSPLNPIPLPNIVALVQGNITTKGNADIYGNLASNSNKITVKKEDKLHGEVVNIPTPIDLASFLPPFPTTPFDNLNLTTDLSQIKNSDIFIKTLSGKLTLDIGSNDRTIYVENLNIEEGIIIKGTGKLNIIVKSKTELEGTLKREDNNPENLNIYYQGTDELEISSRNDKKTTNITGSLHILKSKIDFDGGNIAGNIYYHGSEDLKINGNGKTYSNYIVAPHSFVQTNGNADFTGVILAKEMLINGNHDLNYSAGMLVPLPNPNPSNPTPGTPSSPSDGNPVIIESDIEEK